MGSYHAAYTFDAGPNACLYVLAEHVPHLLSAIQKVFPNDLADSGTYLRGLPIPKVQDAESSKLDSLDVHAKNAFRYIIHTKVGEGPKELSADNSLLINGLPLE